jgi:hypothetical protein
MSYNKREEFKMGINISIDIDKVSVSDGKVIIDIDPNQKDLFESIMIAKNGIKLSDLKPKDEFKIGDEVYIVLEHTEAGTRVISKNFIYKMKFGDNNNYAISTVRDKLNGEYYNKIASIVGENNIIPMKRDLTSLDGLDDYGTCVDNISLLSVSEYAKYHKILGLNSKYPDWWWLITSASTPSNGYSRGVCCVSSDGVPGWDGCDYSRGVRPFLTLESSIFVLKSN